VRSDGGEVKHTKFLDTQQTGHRPNSTSGFCDAMKSFFSLLLFVLVESLTALTDPTGFSGHSNLIEIVSIIDKSSIFYSLVKLESIIRSSPEPQLLSFHFLSFDSQTEQTLRDYFTSCHSTLRHYEIVPWLSTPYHSHLPFSFSGFDTWIIYSRIYLPLIFSNLDRYLYLDNDLVVNGAIDELWSLATRTFTSPLGLRAARPRPRPSPSQSLLDLLPKSKQKNLSRYSQDTSRLEQRQLPPLVGFVFEVNFAYAGYLHTHFNLSHPLVAQVHQMNHPEIFFNAGVAVVNAIQWRKENITAQAEALLFENTNQPGALFDSKAVGDQGLFYLLLNGRMVPLPPKFNMRRLPNKTVRFLEKDELGRATSLCLPVSVSVSLLTSLRNCSLCWHDSRAVVVLV
jgi:lipopolysaccharide biosynthesis glycosyltransferase